MLNELLCVFDITLKAEWEIPNINERSVQTKTAPEGADFD